MTEDEFWQIIETSKQKSGGEPREQAYILTLELAALKPDKIIEFNKIHTKFWNESYRVDIWDAAILLTHAGCGDDNFMDFRDWLICQGKEAFYAALENPDSLADVIDITAPEFVEYEDAAVFSSILSAYQLRTGQELPDPVFNSDEVNDNDDVKSSFKVVGDFSTPQELKVRYPKLTAISLKWYGDWLDELN